MICNICEKESVCKLKDGSDVVKCAEFMGIKETDYKMTSDDCISRNEAIDALGYNISITSDEGLDEYRTVLKKMLRKIYDVQKAQIEALPSIQPTTKENLVVGDCISRQAVFEQINCWIGSGEYKYAMSERFIIDRIKTLPPVNPQEPKTGHWISDKNGQYCDKCGNGIKTPYNFCPFCGADMRESEEQESDLGDYPDSIHNQFDNMTGSMNL